MKKKFLAILLTAVMTFAMVPATMASADEGADDGTYYMITFLSGIDYWTGCWAGMQAAAEELGVNVEYTGATTGDYVDEATVLEQVIAKQPAGIAITPVNADGMTPSIDKAIDAGIPVVLFDSNAPASKAYTYLGTDGYSAGWEVAKTMAEQMGHKGKVGIVMKPGLQNQEDRSEGFEAYMAANEPDIVVLERANAGDTEQESAAATASMIQANQDITGIFSVAAFVGLGSATAIEESGLGDQITAIAFDTDEGVLDAVDRGTLYGTVAQGTRQMGYWSLYFLYALNHESVVPGWAEKGLAPIPKSVDTGVSIITADSTASVR